MYKVSDYYLALDAAKDARAQQISCLVQGFATRMVGRLHRQRDGGAGSPTLIAAHLPPSAAAEQRISGCFRESSPSLS